MAKLDPRRSDYFDTPGNTDSEADEMRQPRRRRRKRRDSLGTGDGDCSSEATDGFRYHKQTKRCPASLAKKSSKSSKLKKSSKSSKLKKSSKSSKSKKSSKASKSKEKSSKSSNSSKETSSKSSNSSESPLSVPEESMDIVREKKPKLIAPEYPTADAFKPTTDWEESTPPELVLMKLLRQIVDSEMSLVSDTYKGEFEFVSDAAANVCRKFLAETNDRVAERLDSGEAMKPVQPLPNPANKRLINQERIWSKVVESGKRELQQWQQSVNRAVSQADDIDEHVKETLISYCREMNVAVLSKGLFSSNVNRIASDFEEASLNSLEAFKVVSTLSSAVERTRQEQQRIAQLVGRSSLETYQKVADAKTLISSIISRS